MRHLWVALGLLLLTCGPTHAALQEAGIGKPAPSFTLEGVIGGQFRQFDLASYRGKWVILFFYPNDFSFVCPTEISGFNKELDKFKELNAEIFGVSVDSKFSHLAWIKKGDLGDLKYPLLADFSKEVTRTYGILDEKTSAAFRALFIIDPEGILQYSVVHNMNVGRSVEETLRVLQALQTGELCPLGWKPGQKTIQKK